jgi:hypothetical protein
VILTLTSAAEGVEESGDGRQHPGLGLRRLGPEERAPAGGARRPFATIVVDWQKWWNLISVHKRPSVTRVAIGDGVVSLRAAPFRSGFAVLSRGKWRLRQRRLTCPRRDRSSTRSSGRATRRGTQASHGAAKPLHKHNHVRECRTGRFIQHPRRALLSNLFAYMGRLSSVQTHHDTVKSRNHTYWTSVVLSSLQAAPPDMDHPE